MTSNLNPRNTDGGYLIAMEMLSYSGLRDEEWYCLRLRWTDIKDQQYKP
jgi:hypothetical protein